MNLARKLKASALDKLVLLTIVCLFDLILYVPSTIFQLNRNWVEPVLSYDNTDDC